jgi:hypothetical protein
MVPRISRRLALPVARICSPLMTSMGEGLSVTVTALPREPVVMVTSCSSPLESAASAGEGDEA